MSGPLNWREESRLSTGVARPLKYWHPVLLVLLCGVLTGCATVPHQQAGHGRLSTSSQYRPCVPPEELGMGAGMKRTPDRPRSSQVLLAVSGGAPSSGDGQLVQGYNVPGRNPGSQMPWEFFLGNAAHTLIAYMYKVNRPMNSVFYNSQTLVGILRRTDGADPAQLLADQRNLRPDITDVSALMVFEIKPWNEQGLQEGRQEVLLYLAALNRAMPPAMNFVGGTDFSGQVLIRFAQGQYIWRLEWQTTEPGVIQYRWTRSQQRFESERAAYDAGQWVEFSVEEMQQYGGWVGEAVEGLVTRREQLATFRGAIGVCIDVIGTTAMGFFSGAIFSRMGGRPEIRQPPAQPPGQGGQIIPFPVRPPSTSTPVRLPAASGG